MKQLQKKPFLYDDKVKTYLGSLHRLVGILTTNNTPKNYVFLPKLEYLVNLIPKLFQK